MKHASGSRIVAESVLQCVAVCCSELQCVLLSSKTTSMFENTRITRHEVILRKEAQRTHCLYAYTCPVFYTKRILYPIPEDPYIYTKHPT